MITLILAAIDSFGTSDFELMYFGSFILDLSLINCISVCKSGKECV